MAEEEKDSWALIMHFDHKIVNGKLVVNKPTTYTLAVAIPCRTCGTVTDRIADDVEHSIEASCKPECDPPIQAMDRMKKITGTQ